MTAMWPRRCSNPFETGWNTPTTDALADSAIDFLAWSIFDPRAAVARLEQVPFIPQFDRPNDARALVSEMLGLSYEERRRRKLVRLCGSQSIRPRNQVRSEDGRGKGGD